MIPVVKYIISPVLCRYASQFGCCEDLQELPGEPPRQRLGPSQLLRIPAAGVVIRTSCSSFCDAGEIQVPGRPVSGDGDTIRRVFSKQKAFLRNNLHTPLPLTPLPQHHTTCTQRPALCPFSRCKLGSSAPLLVPVESRVHAHAD